MARRRRFAATAAALALAAGGVLAVPTAASAASGANTLSSHGYTTKSACQTAEKRSMNNLVKNGAIIKFGTSCGYLDAKKKWGYSIGYTWS
ncbi:hypothetical protein [Microbacterium sp. GXF7504]